MKQKKEVKTNLEGTNFDFYVYLDIKKGLNPSQIAAKYKMSKQRIDYYIKRLKLNGYIEKVGYGVWKVLKKRSQNEHKDTNLNLRNFLTSPKSFKQGFNPDSIRGHAFAFVLKIPKIKNWDKRMVWLEREKVPFKKIGFGGSVQSFIFKNFKVWLGNKSVVVYFSKWKHYFTDTPNESKNYAIHDFLEVIKALERFLGCSFKISNDYVFRPSKQHYALIKNSLANQYNREGKRLMVYDKGGLWLLIDDSLKLSELEGVHKDTGVSDTEKVQNLFNSIKKQPFTAEDVQDLKDGEKEIFGRVKGISEGLMDISLVLKQFEDVTTNLTKEVLILKTERGKK